MNEIKPKGRLLTIKEAAKMFDGLTEYRVRQMCLCNQVPSFKAGNKILIYEENLVKVITGGSLTSEQVNA